MLELILASGGNYELYLKAFKAINGDDAFKKLMDSAQSAHNTGEIRDKIYEQIKDNSSNETLEQIKAKLEQLINLEDKDFIPLLNNIIKSKKADIAADNGQGSTFVKKIDEIEKIESEKEHLEELKKYLTECLEKGIGVLNQDSYSENEEIIPNQLLGKIIKSIEDHAEKEYPEKKQEIIKNYQLNLVMELIDSGSMYGSGEGEASCRSGTITKCTLVVIYLIPDYKKEATNKKYDISAVSFDMLSFIDSIVKNFKYDECEWRDLKDFQVFYLKNYCYRI